MRILLVSSHAFPSVGGVENSLRYISRELLHMGHEVKIWCLQTSPDYPLRCLHEGVEILRAPYKKSRWPHIESRRRLGVTQHGIRPVLESFRPDAVWSRSAPIGLGVVRSGFAVPVYHILPVTARMDADSLYLRTQGMPLKRRAVLLSLWPLHLLTASRIEKELLRACQPIVFSENMRDAVRRSYGLAIYEKTRLIRPGVDSKFFSPTRGEGLFSRIEREYGLSPSEGYILFVGRFSAMKNLYSLVDALEHVEPPRRLVLVGEGSEESRLRNYCSLRGLGDRVVFVGRQAELLPGFYAMARVLVNPSLIEPFGQTLLEAMSCGTPVVGFGGRHGRIATATHEIVRDGVTGRVVEDASPSALAGAIQSILELPEEHYTAMSQKCVEEVAERFSWRRFVDEMLAFILVRS